MQHGRKIQEVTMREINWKKLVGAASAAVLAATQVAPAITAYAEEAGTTDYVYCAASLTWLSIGRMRRLSGQCRRRQLGGFFC